jgi:hypothetical protein
MPGTVPALRYEKMTYRPVSRLSRRRHILVALIGVVAISAACAKPVPGQPVAAGGHSTQSSSPAITPTHPPVAARDLLLGDGDQTPLGPGKQAPVGSTFFTTVRPPECDPALLFKDSPLRPAGSTDHAESSYSIRPSAIYAESADVYDKALNPHDVVWKGFGAVANCNATAVGVAPAGQSPPMQLRGLSVPSDGVLEWVMAGTGETCAFGMAVIPDAALLLVACDTEGKVDMKEWAAKRRKQIMSHIA